MYIIYIIGLNILEDNQKISYVINIILINYINLY